MTKLAPVDAGTFVVQRAVRAAPSVAQLRELAAARVLDPSILDEHEPFYWRAIVSSDQLDAYWTHMLESSLRNYATDFEEGRSFQDSHLTNGQERNLGQSVAGRFVRSNGSLPTRVEADFFTLLGVDDRIDTWTKRIRGGLMPDVSIGFYGARYICDVCGNDLFSGECRHWPGFPYEVVDKKGQPTGETKIATAGVDGAHAGEASSVADGATPAAAVVKAMRAVESGDLTPEQAALLEQRYRIRLPGAHHSWPGAGDGERAKPTEPPAPPAATTPAPEVADVELSERILTFARQQGAPDTVGDPEAAIAHLDAELKRLRAVETAHNAAKPLIADGEAYRAALVEDALTNGVRALGDEFARDDWKPVLEGMPVERIKLLSGGWAKQGDRQFAGGRATTDRGEDAPNNDKRSAGTPDYAFVS